MISLGLTGFPLGHSLSPRLHQTALAYCGLEGSYSLYPVETENRAGLENLLERVRAGEINGLNVTIPYKQTVIPMLDDLSPAARAIGAVNTIFLSEGKLSGDNTDAPGFMADLRRLLDLKAGDRRKDKRALVLGAGGAARAVAYALLSDGWSVTIAARREQQARELKAQFLDHQLYIKSIDFNADVIRTVVGDITLMVNTTPLGMLPEVEHSPWPENLPLPQGAVCYDLVYNPRETRFIREAKVAGLKADTGLGMLVYQAALAFEIWTGRKVPADHLLAAVEVV